MVYIIGEHDSDIDMDAIDIMGKINWDKVNFIKNGDKNGIGALRVILGEIQRDPNKDYSQENVIKILRSLRRTTLKSPVVDILMVSLIDTYIPPPVSDKEVIEWLAIHYSADDIKAMGKGAFKLIGEAKKYYKGLDFNAEILKDAINDIIR